jgi:hypothetical protein
VESLCSGAPFLCGWLVDPGGEYERGGSGDWQRWDDSGRRGLTLFEGKSDQVRSGRWERVFRWQWVPHKQYGTLKIPEGFLDVHAFLGSSDEPFSDGGWLLIVTNPDADSSVASCFFDLGYGEAEGNEGGRGRASDGPGAGEGFDR